MLEKGDIYDLPTDVLDDDDDNDVNEDNCSITSTEQGDIIEFLEANKVSEEDLLPTLVKLE